MMNSVISLAALVAGASAQNSFAVVTADGDVYATGGSKSLIFEKLETEVGHYCMNFEGASNSTANFGSAAVSVNVQDGYGPNGYGMHNTAHGDKCNFMGGTSILLYDDNDQPAENWFTVLITESGSDPNSAITTYASVQADGSVYSTDTDIPLVFEQIGTGHYCMNQKGAPNSTANFVSQSIQVSVQDGYGPNGWAMHNSAHGDDCNFMGGTSILLYDVKGQPMNNSFSVIVSGLQQSHTSYLYSSFAVVKADGGTYTTGSDKPLFFQKIATGHYCMNFIGASNSTANFGQTAVSVNIQDGYGPNGFGMYNVAHGDKCNFMGGASILLYDNTGAPMDNWFSVIVTGPK